MPISTTDLIASAETPNSISELPFPPVTKAHILACSYHSWYPRYRSLTPKARILPLDVAFLSYLRADGILLPPDSPTTSETPASLPTPPQSDSEDSDSEDDAYSDPSAAWPDLHSSIQSAIAELGGSVMPRLNWSAPKDATWISATNSMECRTANDIYLLLKSSDFVTHDLEQVFEGVEEEEDDDDDDDEAASDDSEEEETSASILKARELATIPYHLVLRKTVPAWNPALEFRCFVRSRRLLCICQRDLNHYSFLPTLVPKLRSLIEAFFEKNLRASFPNADFAFDVYIPPPHTRVWLVDVNPWAIRTDPLLFSWLEILKMSGDEQGVPESFRFELNISDSQDGIDRHQTSGSDDRAKEDEGDDFSEDDEEEDAFTPEFRLVHRDDPEAYTFNTPQYSAHKLPKDVVDAGNSGEAGLREFMGTWREIVRKQEVEENGGD